MKTAVLYFSRTGNSKRVAEKIAQKLHGETACITDEESWKGPGGFARGAMFAAKWEITHPVVSPIVDYKGCDRIVIIGPVWAANPAPAVYSLIMQELKEYANKVTLVLTCGGMNMPIPSKIESKIGKTNTIFVIAKFGDIEDNAIDRIVRDLNEKQDADNQQSSMLA